MSLTGALLLDLIIALIVIVRTFVGYRTGLLAGVLGLIGVFGGAALGWWVGPHLLNLLPIPPLAKPSGCPIRAGPTSPPPTPSQACCWKVSAISPM